MTNEQILRKTFELIEDDIKKHQGLYICSVERLEDYLNKAKEILDTPVLSTKQREHLKEDIKYLELATNHKYYAIMYGDVGVFPKVTFAYKSEKFNEDRFDSIGGSPCYTNKLKPNKVYYLKELLDESNISN